MKTITEYKDGTTQEDHHLTEREAIAFANEEVKWENTVMVTIPECEWHSIGDYAAY